MRLSSISITNFRGLKGTTTVSLENSDIIFLVGQNNTGKSSILKAYEYLVNSKQKSSQSDFYGYTAENPIEIEAVFITEEGDDVEFAKDGLIKWVAQDSTIRVKKKWDAIGEVSQKYTFNPATNDFVKNGFGGFDTIFQNKAPTPIVIPAVPKQEELGKWLADVMKKSVLRSLEKDESELYAKAMNTISELQNKIVGHSTIKELNTQANFMFQRIFPNLEIVINIAEGDGFDLLQALEKEFSVTIKDDRLKDIAQRIDSQGTGVIRQAMFNILGMIKNEKIYENWGNGATKKEYILLFEEPEIYLHPQKLKILRRNLYKLCRNSPFQILCASHSPGLIDLSQPHNSIVRVFRREDGTITSFQVDDTLFDKDGDEKNQLHMLNRFNPHVCEVFFADEAVLVEGDTEAIVLRELLSKHERGNDICVVNTGSKNNIPLFQKILTHFAIKQHVIHDSDSKKIRRKDGKEQANSAWKLNEEIWSGIEKSTKSGVSARRFVHIPNFEASNGYTYHAGKGKPLSAYEFVKPLNLNSNEPICSFAKVIAEETEFETPFEPEVLDKAAPEFIE